MKFKKVLIRINPYTRRYLAIAARLSDCSNTELLERYVEDGLTKEFPDLAAQLRTKYRSMIDEDRRCGDRRIKSNGFDRERRTGKDRRRSS